MLIMQEGKQLTDLVYEAKRIAVTASRESGVDGACAAFALYRALLATGKVCRFLYPYQIPEELKDTIRKDDLTKVEGARGLMIELDFGGTNIEKIKYSVEKDVCKLVLLPAPKNLDLSKIKYVPFGFDYDLLITVGAQKLEDLDILTKEFSDVLKDTKIINIDKSTKNENFGILNVVEPEADSLSQMMLHKLSTWHYKVDKETAKVLLQGMSAVA